MDEGMTKVMGLFLKVKQAYLDHRAQAAIQVEDCMGYQWQGPPSPKQIEDGFVQADPKLYPYLTSEGKKEACLSILMQGWKHGELINDGDDFSATSSYTVQYPWRGKTTPIAMMQDDVQISIQVGEMRDFVLIRYERPCGSEPEIDQIRSPDAKAALAAQGAIAAATGITFLLANR